ncbi:nucleoside hydrolase [Sediminispirochaeta bajacaliforniensis]|uniref:nucleoside hydrolase n=1 Tax=Sediminispirochaeta bajacaliforniensis TaxID=148 RepID=UPI0003812F2E|nr:nucleoside hydrolase [Sediminispirochaeta bajacaliforniensis]
MKEIILDCDPGHDDAIAMMLAIGNSEKLRVSCISTVGGNQILEKTTVNALDLLYLMKANIPVVAGQKGPLVRPLEIAENVHGKSGLDGPLIESSPYRPLDRNFIDVYTDILKASEQKVTIVATGPQSNIATFILARPELKHKIEQIVFMGGSCFGGNWSPKAEFNIYVDPEAAQIVANSGIPLVMCGLDVTHKATVTTQEVEDFSRIGNRTGVVLKELIDFYAKTAGKDFLCEDEGPKIRLHDVTTIAYLLRPDIFTSRELFVTIDTSNSPYSRGATIVDYDKLYSKTPNMRVCFGIDRSTFVNELFAAVKKLP